jgi:hypothetical protein
MVVARRGRPLWLLVGGRKGTGARTHRDGAHDTEDIVDVWTFDFAAHTWTDVLTTGAEPAPRRSHGLAVLPTTEGGRSAAVRVLMYGGRAEGVPVLSETFELTLVL